MMQHLLLLCVFLGIINSGESRCGVVDFHSNIFQESYASQPGVNETCLWRVHPPNSSHNWIMYAFVRVKHNVQPRTTVFLPDDTTFIGPNTTLSNNAPCFSFVKKPSHGKTSCPASSRNKKMCREPSRESKLWPPQLEIRTAIGSRSSSQVSFSVTFIFIPCDNPVTHRASTEDKAVEVQACNSALFAAASLGTAVLLLLLEAAGVLIYIRFRNYGTIKKQRTRRPFKRSDHAAIRVVSHPMPISRTSSVHTYAEPEDGGEHKYLDPLPPDVLHPYATLSKPETGAQKYQNVTDDKDAETPESSGSSRDVAEYLHCVPAKTNGEMPSRRQTEAANGITPLRKFEAANERMPRRQTAAANSGVQRP